MSRGAVRQKNRRARRAEMAQKVSCSVEGCKRRGIVKVELENDTTVIFCRKHNGAALAKGFYKTNKGTEFV